MSEENMTVEQAVIRVAEHLLEQRAALSDLTAHRQAIDEAFYILGYDHEAWPTITEAVLKHLREYGE